MKKFLTAFLLVTVLVFCGFSSQENPREYYASLLGQGIITAQEYEPLERYAFELPESERSPLDGFVIGEITTCAIGEQG
ncbi:hypothetical protein [Harryflintia acetispora]|uniref:Uncharacterized protein n=1 Tax=Harryflintia acetispora TaxID=1849041 RepID=A0A9X8UHV0_9FIRM|nr:hypothetical protein [Harryflintia acetispora]TCL42489.1 hypothetical protein EDD78_110115 [Harryflintia acetispora]